MFKNIIGRDDVHKAFIPQTVVWRPLFVYNNVMMPTLHRIAPRQDSADPMLRVRLTGCGQAICEPTVSTDGRGMICFLKSNLPECWTHLVIMRNGKNGSVLMALPECLPDVEAYIAWRLKVASLYHSPEGYSEAQLAALIAALPCPGLQTNRNRVQVFPDNDSGGIALYEPAVTVSA